MGNAHDSNEPEHLPNSVAEFIGQLVKKMRYRRRVREEVRTELTAHFQDELSGCAEGEREERATQLIVEFGDPKLLGILIRRAKKRCRPLWHTACARTIQAIAVLFLCLIVYVVWFFSGKPAITTDYVTELTRIVRPTADESLNAAPFYGRAAQLHGRLSQEFLLYFAENHQMFTDAEDPSSGQRLSEAAELADEVLAYQNWDPPHRDTEREVYKTVSEFLTKLGYSELTADQLNLVDRWVQEHNDALELVVEGARLPHCWLDYTSTGQVGSWVTKNGSFSGSILRELCRALRWRALRRAEHGGHKAAFNDLITLYRFGLHVRTDKLLLEQLVGIALQGTAVQTARTVVGRNQISVQVLADFQRKLERIVADQDFSISFTANRLWSYDEIQKCFTSDRIGKGHLYLPRFRELDQPYGRYSPASSLESTVMNLREYGRWVFTHPNKEQTLETARKLYDYYEQLKSKTAVQRHTEKAAIERKLRELVKGNKLLQYFGVGNPRIIEIGNRICVDVGATLTIVAAHRYKAERGQFPRDLDQLVADKYLNKLPIDIFADKPLVYKRMGDNFILYSFGPNLRDDAGVSGTDGKGRPKRWTDNGDTVFWPLVTHQVRSQ